MITLRDKLSHLTFNQACKLLGPKGSELVISGGKYSIDISEDVIFTQDLFLLRIFGSEVTIRLDPGKSQNLNISCSGCSGPCEHKGAALALILEEKLLLGLSAPPPEKAPIESLSDEELIERALEERKDRALSEKLHLESLNKEELWTDYIVTNNTSGKSYRIALRGWERGESFCSCPDYRKNTLGTCKHILFAIEKTKKRFNKSVQKTPYKIREICVYLKYTEDLELRLLIPEEIDAEVRKILEPITDKAIVDLHDLIDRIQAIENSGSNVTIYPDAQEYIDKHLYIERVSSKVKEIRADPKNHPLRTSLLKTELLAYQLDGIAFAVGAGRAILADDMGLGKTIQGIGVAQLLAQDIDISRVLVICPASLKSQWLLEIDRFTDRSRMMVMGKAQERQKQYDNPNFFTICNYEQVLRDIRYIESIAWDLIILDEGQRIKNWEAKTSQTIKSLRSPFALVLTGTPLENRLEELFSVVEFIDDRRLGPGFKFYNRHRITDAKGKLLGYKNLDEVRLNLKPVLLRRTKQEVMKQLPPRTTEIRRIPPTEEQMEIHNSHQKIVQTIIRKRFLTEMDILRLQKALLMCRMSANSTYLVDKVHPGYSSKLEELEILISQLLEEEDRKIILFSEWTTMLNLIEPILNRQKAVFVRLDGSVPQKKRQGLVHQFQNDPGCRFFITTNAGSTGLNLQAANTIINVDLPWNPAILEQRIGRAHRMGQKRPVQIFLMITENTLEENLLFTLSAKKELSVAVLDPNADTKEVSFSAGIDELKARMEILLGAKPDAPIDETKKEQIRQEARELERNEKISKASGQLIGAAFEFIGAVFDGSQESEKTNQLMEVFKKTLSEGITRDENGEMKMTITLPNDAALEGMAKSLAHIVSAGIQAQ